MNIIPLFNHFLTQKMQLQYLTSYLTLIINDTLADDIDEFEFVTVIRKREENH